MTVTATGGGEAEAGTAVVVVIEVVEEATEVAAGDVGESRSKEKITVCFLHREGVIGLWNGGPPPRFCAENVQQDTPENSRFSCPNAATLERYQNAYICSRHL